MFKKVVYSLMTAALLVVSFSGTVFAAEGDHPELVKARGEVIAVDPAAGKFRLEKSDGTVLTVFVTEKTTFRGLESLEEMQVGWHAGIAAREDSNGKLWAVAVIAGETSDVLKVHGKVTDVNTSAGKYSIEKPDGTKMTFFVDERTRYGGQISSLEDLQEGWQAGISYKEQGEGKLITLALIAGTAPELVKAQGKVTSVNANGGMFEITTPDGVDKLFYVDENTRYQGQLSSLAEMQVGWQAGVTAKVGEDGQLNAVMVIAGTRPEPIRAQGIIKNVSPGAGKFQLEKSDGTVLSVYVDENTNYRGQVVNFDDLDKGMRAGIVAIENKDGKLIARLVIAGDPRPERPEGERPEGERPEGERPERIRPDGERPTPEPEFPLDVQPADPLT